MNMLGVLEEEGGLKNFTTLANAVISVDESLQSVEDRWARTCVSRMLDRLISQAYRGEKPMSFLAVRAQSMVETLRRDVETRHDAETCGPSTSAGTVEAMPTIRFSPSGVPTG